MAYTSYDIRRSITPTSGRDFWVKRQYKLIEREFSNASTYRQIYKYTYPDDAIEPTYETIDVRVTTYHDKTGTGKSSISDDFKKILFSQIGLTVENLQDISVEKLAYSSLEDVKVATYKVVEIGDKFMFDGETWIVVDTNNFSNIYATCTIRRANNLLKWYNSKGQYHTQYAVLDYSMQSILGIANAKDSLFQVGDGKYFIATSNNHITQNIQRDDRFILGDLAYKVTNIDRITKEGLLLFVVLEHQIDLENDDLNNGIADAFNKDVYQVQAQVDDVSFAVDDTYQIEYEIIKNGNVVSNTDYDVVFVNNNNSIISIDGDGLVTGLNNGTGSIDVVLQNNTDVYDTVNFEVADTPTDNVEEIINGNEYLFLNLSNTYTVYKYLNGVEQSDTYTIEVIDVDSIVEVTNIEDNSITIESLGTVGNIVIQATNDTTDEVVTKNITVRTLW